MPKPEIVSLRRSKVPAASPSPVKATASTSKLRKKEDKPPFQYQSIGFFRGHLYIDDDRLRFKSVDGCVIPICGIDSRLSLWLMSHPAQMFSSEYANWLVYPRCEGGSRKLKLQLKSYCGQNEGDLPLGTALIKGKVLSTDDNRSIIGIRRNIPPSTYKLLVQWKLLQPGGELDQFVVPVVGNAGEVGSFVELKCKLHECDLVITK